MTKTKTSRKESWLSFPKEHARYAIKIRTPQADKANKMYLHRALELTLESSDRHRQTSQTLTKLILADAYTVLCASLNALKPKKAKDSYAYDVEKSLRNADLGTEMYLSRRGEHSAEAQAQAAVRTIGGNQ